MRDVLDVFGGLIEKLTAENGNGRRELESRVQLGEVTEDEAVVIMAHCLLRKIMTGLESLEAKL